VRADFGDLPVYDVRYVPVTVESVQPGGLEVLVNLTHQESGRSLRLVVDPQTGAAIDMLRRGVVTPVPLPQALVGLAVGAPFWARRQA
jgi:hypothetical protein